MSTEKSGLSAPSASRGYALLERAAHGKVTLGWASAGGHGSKREDAVVWADRESITIVRPCGKRIIVELCDGQAEKIAQMITGG